MKWSANLAYAVGMITTDGNLSSDKRHISITSTDKELLQTIKWCLNKFNPVSLNPPSSIGKKIAYRLQFSDVKLYRWLEKIGLHPNKSLTIGPLKINRKYFRDFLRGHLDGDGSIVHYLDKYLTPLNPKYIYNRLFVYFISGSKPHIEWLRNEIVKAKKIHGSFNPRKNKSDYPTYVLKFSTKEAKVLLNWIYYKPALPCLNRKFRIAEPFLLK